MNAEENWDGPVQDAIREHDKALGHAPPAPAVSEADWFRRFPNGGTVFVRPGPNTLSPVDYFRHAPNGGATVFLNPAAVSSSEQEDTA